MSDRTIPLLVGAVESLQATKLARQLMLEDSYQETTSG
jgi:hypothetical protein